MKKILFISIITIFIACNFDNQEQAAYDTSTSYNTDNISYDELRNILYQKESKIINSHDYQFIKIKVKGHRTIWNAFKVKIAIANRALITKTKDFKIKLFFYNQSHELLDSMILTVSKICNPQQQIYYGVKIREIPQDLNSVEGELLSFSEAGKYDNLGFEPSFVNFMDEIDKIFNFANF